MLKFEELLWKQSERDRKKRPTRDERQRAENLFHDWRNRYVAVLARNIRFQRMARLAGKQILKGLPPAEWSNAAIHLLTIPNETIQDWFLRSPSVEKNKIVAAVLADGGIYNPNGRFIELPPL